MITHLFRVTAEGLQRELMETFKAELSGGEGALNISQREQYVCREIKSNGGNSPCIGKLPWQRKER